LCFFISELWAWFRFRFSTLFCTLSFMQTPYWSFEDAVAFLSEAPRENPGKALVMFSSLRGAMVTDPRLMWVPVDDHLVHRGDGVFETLLFEGGGVYNLPAHLQRLEASAAALGLKLPMPLPGLTRVIEDCFHLAGKERALARLLLGRGPGGFSVDSAESMGPSIYCMVYEAPLPFMQKNPGGGRAILSRIPPKSGGLANIKTCNYIPNALMKAEATAAGVHFALGVDEDGYLTESYTENLAAIDREGRLILPPPTRHLAGTTLQRVGALAASEGRKVLSRPLRASELFEMAEVLIVGTTAYVTRLVELDGKALPRGPEALWLNQLLLKDIYGGGEIPNFFDK
jgi:branched-subunit amino acid aminotransferase/4-amino-4-deoxychorismate lyase